MTKGRYSVPERWLDYSPVGQLISGFPIQCCKVPLRDEIVRKLSPDDWFTPENLLELVPNVGCIVDLTATDRYYNVEIFIGRGIKHVKIKCQGHQLPAKQDVQRFFTTLDEFFDDVQSVGKVLMVHCTHGVNRTGYLVTRYLVERKGMVPKKAIEAFNKARGHPIERDVYIGAILGIQRSCSSVPETESVRGSRKAEQPRAETARVSSQAPRYVASKPLANPSASFEVPRSHSTRSERVISTANWRVERSEFYPRRKTADHSRSQDGRHHYRKERHSRGGDSHRHKDRRRDVREEEEIHRRSVLDPYAPVNRNRTHRSYNQQENGYSRPPWQQAKRTF